MLSSPDNGLRLHWEDFVEIFRRFSVFMVDESVRLLKDKDATTRELLEAEREEKKKR